MKKKISALLMMILIAFATSAGAMTIQYDGKTVEYNEKPMTVSVNDKSISMPLSPIVFNSRALVPVREVFEAINAKVTYDEKKKDITLNNGDTKIVITINKNSAYVNGKSTSIPDGLTPKLINKAGESAKTMVPIRFLSETLGMTVRYNDSTRNIAVYTPDYKIPENTDKPDGSKLIVIDAGHGGKDSGALGKIGDTTINEKDLTLSIAAKTVNILKSSGLNVMMTRDSDTYPTLEDRVNFANGNNASLFVSIHINANDKPEPYGIETYYCTTNNNNDYGITSEALAGDIQKNLIENLGGKNRGVKTANFYVIKNTVMPAVLIETGFITNEEEVKKLADDSYQQKAAEAIASAITKNISSVIK